MLTPSPIRLPTLLMSLKSEPKENASLESSVEFAALRANVSANSRTFVLLPEDLTRGVMSFTVYTR